MWQNQSLNPFKCYPTFTFINLEPFILSFCMREDVELTFSAKSCVCWVRKCVKLISAYNILSLFILNQDRIQWWFSLICTCSHSALDSVFSSSWCPSVDSFLSFNFPQFFRQWVSTRSCLAFGAPLVAAVPQHWNFHPSDFLLLPDWNQHLESTSVSKVWAL